MRIVVCDTGPVLHLSEAGALGLIEKTGEVLIPPIVDHEIGRHIQDWTSRRPGWLRVESPQHPRAEQLEQWAAQIDLGAGEMEAIVLARSRAADWLLTDDAAARVVATLLGMEVHGSLGVVLWQSHKRTSAGTRRQRSWTDWLCRRFGSAPRSSPKHGARSTPCRNGDPR